MQRLKLIQPTGKHRLQVEDFKQKFLTADEEMHGVGKLETQNFDEWMQGCTDMKAGKNLGKYVPATQFITIRESDDKLIGMIQIRHFLTPHLLQSGGHIGYCIAPDERRNGYATDMLALALEECKTMGIDKVLITARPNNIGSVRTIEKNGGILENEIIDEKNKPLQRFWINNNTE